MIANPVSDVLSELSTQIGSGVTYAFVGASDHAVSCLNYGDSTIEAAQLYPLSQNEMSRPEQAQAQARELINPATGIMGISTGKSNDRPGEAAILVYVDKDVNADVPANVGGVRTEVIMSSVRPWLSGLLH